jgi:hypothetical protein
VAGQLQRAWVSSSVRGDAGGAPVLANAGRGDWSVYDDARELLADVEALLGGKQ